MLGTSSRRYPDIGLRPGGDGRPARLGRKGDPFGDGVQRPAGLRRRLTARRCGEYVTLRAVTDVRQVQGQSARRRRARHDGPSPAPDREAAARSWGEPQVERATGIPESSCQPACERASPRCADSSWGFIQLPVRGETTSKFDMVRRLAVIPIQGQVLIVQRPESRAGCAERWRFSRWQRSSRVPT